MIGKLIIKAMLALCLLNGGPILSNICIHYVLHPTYPMAMGADLPFFADVGYLVVDRVHWAAPYPHYHTPFTLTAVAPVGTERGGSLMDLQKVSYRDGLPERFVIGDGSSQRCLVGVDRSPGSQLSAWLKRIKRQIDYLQLANQPLPLSVAQALNNNLANNMGLVSEDPGDGGKYLRWDKAFLSLPLITVSLINAASDHLPVDLKTKMPIAPLHWNIEKVQGYCLQQSLVASFILRMYGINHRIVNGALAYFAPDEKGIVRLYTPGHTWIELETKEVLDVARQKFGFPTRIQHGNVPPNYPNGKTYENDWIHLPDDRIKTATGEVDVWRFEYDRYLILNLDGTERKGSYEIH